MRNLSVDPGFSDSIYSFLYSSFLIICVILSAGCLHAPPAGVMRGIVQVENMRPWENLDGNNSTWSLTGIAIGKHTVVTAGHTFMHDPELGHPIKINGKPTEFSIVSDGLHNRRPEREFGDKELSAVFIKNDYLVLQTVESYKEYATLRIAPVEEYTKIKHATLVSRNNVTGERVSIPLKDVSLNPDGGFLAAKLPKERVQQLYLSGSPLIGIDREGNLVLTGIASSYGSAYFERFGERVEEDDYIFFTPAYIIPIDLTDH